MGYWEQIGEGNRREVERRAGLPWFRRLDWLAVAAVIVAAVFWTGMGLAIWRALPANLADTEDQTSTPE
jgi:hypothetical protein